jgi:CubicO group peptidase (beta-lactamase class C family)
MQRRDFLYLGLLPLALPARAAPRDSDALVTRVEELVPRLMREAVVPGVSMAIVREGKMIWSRGFGVKDSVSLEPVDNDTVFEAASVSKTVFAYAVMKLCEQGIIGLDTPLVKYAPRRFLDDPRLDLVTARHVLSHTAGFPDWRSREKPLAIQFAPGSRFSYSGEGYFYLQLIVSHLVGRALPQPCGKYECDFEVCATDIDETMKRRVLEPFGMSASGYVWNEFFARHTARPHDVAGKPLAKSKPNAADAARYASAGGLHTTAADYAKFLLAVIHPKPADAFRLGRATWQEMLRPQVKLPKGEEIDGAGAWALGWAIQERPTGNVIVHSGGQTGFRSLTMASVDRKSGFVILTNSDNGGKICYDEKLGTLLTPLLAG